MKISERGQITIPKSIREQFGLNPSIDVDFVVENGELKLRKKTSIRKRSTNKWIGYLNGKPDDIDQYIEEIRGR